ncbi:Adipocyte plasma membrane-associated protein [Aphelenchoides bicaudatus]|nr:Adipocyte plasma membrane-associated protein [Aphelenchoides bicaudatus]
MSCSILISILVILFGVYVAYLHSRMKYKFSEFDVPSARPLEKSVPTLIIKEYELLARGQVNGIESLAVVDGVIYAGDQDCNMLKIENGKVTQKFPLIKNKQCSNCCAPLGIRYWHAANKFVILDAILGVLVLDYSTESVEQLYSSINLLGKYSNMFANDFDFINNDTIVLSDFAGGYSMSDGFVCFYGATRTSRLIQFNLRTREAKVLLDDQLGLNGVQSHTDKQSVLVAQSITSQIFRYYFAGPKQGKVEVFIDKMLGYPDNIRPSSKGNTFWVPHFAIRAPGTRTLAQRLGPYPALRSWLYSITQAIHPELFYLISGIGETNLHTAVELDVNGKIVSAVIDEDGVLPFTTQVTDDGTYFSLTKSGSMASDLEYNALRYNLNKASFIFITNGTTLAAISLVVFMFLYFQFLFPSIKTIHRRHQCGSSSKAKRSKPDDKSTVSDSKLSVS